MIKFYFVENGDYCRKLVWNHDLTFVNKYSINQNCGKLLRISQKSNLTGGLVRDARGLRSNQKQKLNNHF